MRSRTSWDEFNRLKQVSPKLTNQGDKKDLNV
ncbi:hypothetical protein Celal_3269 [Cellulophaga algicola DSM 14237]|uniref:Uncharacterized protein n=1 Tax=Cellulophaga algicola (strain DSM 14237 / IC166 / ACAM 630) TaxID=688270 RepID=E6X5I1_CELAD|nr:hypothetical protein Celal_3269 [Cellulophaga algicola DSM 14237]